MSAWRLERLRMTRTPRAIALGATYLVFGLLGPVMARYAQEIFNRFESGVQIIMPPPAPKDGIANYISQVSQTGLIVVVIITAGALSFDAHRGLSTFLRTRTNSIWQLIAPRFTINAAAAVTAYTLGTAAAWYETALLLGSPPAGLMFAGLLCAAVPGLRRSSGHRSSIGRAQHTWHHRYHAWHAARLAGPRDRRAAAPLAAQHPRHRPRRLAGWLNPQRLPPRARHNCHQHRPAARGRHLPVRPPGSVRPPHRQSGLASTTAAHLSAVTAPAPRHAASTPGYRLQTVSGGKNPRSAAPAPGSPTQECPAHSAFKPAGERRSAHRPSSRPVMPLIARHPGGVGARVKLDHCASSRGGPRSREHSWHQLCEIIALVRSRR
jgi:hypothetical protein